VVGDHLEHFTVKSSTLAERDKYIGNFSNQLYHANATPLGALLFNDL